eukprot:SAG31_NODE_23455_length_504_cov_0.639506_1_plen_28_part_10
MEGQASAVAAGQGGRLCAIRVHRVAPRR